MDVNRSNNNVIVFNNSSFKRKETSKSNPQTISESKHTVTKNRNENTDIQKQNGVVSAIGNGGLMQAAVQSPLCDSNCVAAASVEDCDDDGEGSAGGGSGGSGNSSAKNGCSTSSDVSGLDQKHSNDAIQCSQLSSDDHQASSEPLLKNYNEYVNQSYGLRAADISTPVKRDEANDEVKPLLSFEVETKKPKSIVKSPSSHSIVKKKYDKQTSLPNATVDGFNNQSNGEQRPVLHVQFRPHNGGPPSAIDNATNATKPCVSPIGSICSSSSSGSSESSSDEDGSSLGQYSEARPPDGGWGWVVVFASFMVNLIADGITFSFGVIFVEFLNYFGEGKGKTAWIGSLFMAMPLLSGPIASFLTDRYGCKKVTVAGSILASFGFVISSFSNSMELLFFTFGIVAGFGLSLCYVAAVVIVAYYFDKRRSFATGLSVCGSGIGTFIFAPLTQFLLKEYGWRGTTLILAGLFLNMTVCGLLMRDLEWTTHKAKQRAKKNKTKLGQSAESFSASNSTNTGGTASNTHQHYIIAEDNEYNEEGINSNNDPRLFSSLITLPTFIRAGERIPNEVLEILTSSRNNQHNANFMNTYPSHSRSFSEPNAASRTPENALSPNNPEKRLQNKNQQVLDEQAFLTWLKKVEGQRNNVNHRPTAAYLKNLRMHRHSLTYRGAMLNINRYRLRASSCPDIYRNSMTTIAKEKNYWYQGVAEFKALFRDILDFSYFADIRFLLFAISNFLLYTWYDVPYVYLADDAIEMGFTDTDASMLISIIGIVNMFGEIALGWVGDKKWINPSLVYAVSMWFCGAVTAMVPLFRSYQALCVLSGLFGLFIAANYSLTSIILVELITLERFTNAYGLLLLVQGIANLVGPPLAGWIYDVTGTYDLSFYIAGAFISVSGAMLFILPSINKYRNYKASRTAKSNNKATLNGTAPKYNGTKTMLSDCFNQDKNVEAAINKSNHV